MSAVYGPRIAAPTFVLVDVVTGARVPRRRLAARRTGARCCSMAAAALGAVPFGTLVLQRADPIVLRWVLARPGRLSALSCSRPAGAITARRICRSRSGRPVRRRERRRGADRRPAGHPLLARQRQPGRRPARQFLGLFFMFSSASLIAYALAGLLTASVSRCRRVHDPDDARRHGDRLALFQAGHRTNSIGGSATSSSPLRRSSACRCSIGSFALER